MVVHDLNVKGEVRKSYKKGCRRRRKIGHTDKNEASFLTQCNKVIVKFQPVITKDSRYILAPCRDVIAIFQINTGLIKDYFCEHNYEVTNVYINQQNPLQVISCSSREFIVWDYSDKQVVKRCNFDFTASAWYINPRSYEDVYYKGVYIKGESNKEQLIKWNITNSHEPAPLGKVSKRVNSVDVSNNGECVAFSYKNTLSVYRSSKSTTDSYSYDSLHLTCIAFHPTEQLVATGDKEGKIILWYVAGGQICTKLHWHSNMVMDLLFTNSGYYLMSGGNEGVLVTWQIETQEKTFLPRVGGTIHYIVKSSDDQYICLSLENNMLKIINNAISNLKKVIKLLAPAYEHPAGLNYHSPTSSLVLNGGPDGVLQFYEPNGDYVSLSLDIVGENFIMSDEDRYVYPTRVKLVDFNNDGTWMATISEREDRILPTERLLKFWKYSEETKNYSLNTVVDPPHINQVNSLHFRPPNKFSGYPVMAITTGEDGFLKSWILSTEINHKGETIEQWQILSIGSFGMNISRHSCFSQQGDILAVLFSAVTLWNPESLSFKRCLQFNVKDDSVKNIKFSYNDSQHHLIGHSDHYLVVWNINDIMDCTVAWMIKTEVCLITCDPYSKYFTAFVRSKATVDLYVFDPLSPKPLDVHYKLIENHAPLIDAMFLPKPDKPIKGGSIWSQLGQFYILTEGTEILTVTEKHPVENKLDYNTDEKENNDYSVFENIFGVFSETNDNIISDVSANAKNTLVGNPSSFVLRKMMTTPVNVLPSADILSKIYMKSLIKKHIDYKRKDNLEEVHTETVLEGKKETSNVITSSVEINEDANKPKLEKYTPSKQLLHSLSCSSFISLQD